MDKTTFSMHIHTSWPTEQRNRCTDFTIMNWIIEAWYFRMLCCRISGNNWRSAIHLSYPNLRAAVHSFNCILQIDSGQSCSWALNSTTLGLRTSQLAVTSALRRLTWLWDNTRHLIQCLVDLLPKSDIRSQFKCHSEREFSCLKCGRNAPCYCSADLLISNRCQNQWLYRNIFNEAEIRLLELNICIDSHRLPFQSIAFSISILYECFLNCSYCWFPYLPKFLNSRNQKKLYLWR